MIKALTKAIECSDETAQFLATVVDREGRSNVRSGGKDACEQAKNVIIERTQRDNRAPLIVEVMDSNIVSHQAFAMRLLNWILEIVQQLRKNGVDFI